MYRIFDVHAHIYPRKIAQKASDAIGAFYNIPMKFDGTPETLLSLGEEFCVSRFLVHSVATSARQVESINQFIAEECRLHPDRFTGFATLHPDLEAPADELNRIKGMGLVGVKLHPDFQKFEISDPKMNASYDAMQELGLPVLFHTGDSRYHWSSPGHIPIIRRRFPRLKIICAHFGAYSQWDEAAECLAEQNVWIDTSSSFFIITREKALDYIRRYGEERVLFGSDYPMWSVGDEIQNILSLGLNEEVNRRIFSENL